MTEKKIGRGNNPKSLENLKKPLPAGHETAVVRVSGPAGVLRWWKSLDADERGRVLGQAKMAGMDGSTTAPDQEYGD